MNLFWKSFSLFYIIIFTQFVISKCQHEEIDEITELNTEPPSASQSYYCEPELCKLWNGTDLNYVNHIGCNNSEKLSNNCPNDAKLVDMNQRRINLLIDLHNAARNRIAMGLVPGYESAENMPILKWDNELEYLASLNVKKCQFAHDACRNTDRFRESGQNIGISWQRPNFNSNSKRIKLIVGLWFDEYKNANQSFIDSFENHPEGKKIGHFTLLVSDRAKRVGCAAIRYSNELKGRAFLITCNYDYNSIYNEAVYQTGLPATNCDFRKSGRYPGLCDWDNDYEDSEESNEITSNLLEIPELL